MKRRPNPLAKSRAVLEKWVVARDHGSRNVIELLTASEPFVEVAVDSRRDSGKRNGRTEPPA